MVSILSFTIHHGSRSCDWLPAALHTLYDNVDRRDEEVSILLLAAAPPE